MFIFFTNPSQKNLGQVEDLKLQIQEKQEEIDKLHRLMADRDLSMQQIEQSRETTLVKLRAAGGENEVSGRNFLKVPE